MKHPVISLTAKEYPLYDQLVVIEYEIKKAKNLAIKMKNPDHTELLDMAAKTISRSKMLITEGHVNLDKKLTEPDLINNAIYTILAKGIGPDARKMITKMKDFNVSCPLKQERLILTEMSRLAKMKAERIDQILKDPIYIKRYNSFFKQ